MLLTGKRGLIFISAGLAIGLAAPACRQAGSAGPVVARVGDQKITVDDVRSRLLETPSASQYAASPEGRRQFLNLLIREKVLLAEAQRMGIPKDPAYQSAIQKFKTEWQRRLVEYQETLLVESALRRLRTTDLSVTDTEVEKYYQEHAAEYQKPTQVVLASHILVATEQDAQTALDRLKAGESFDRVARDMSKDPATAAQGGRMAPFHRGSLVPEFEDAAFRLRVGQTSGIVKTQFGFHIIRKLGEKQLPARPLSDAKEEIRAQMEREKFNQWVTAKQSAMGVQVDEKAMSLLSLEEPSKP